MLEITNLFAGYGQNQILRNINLTFTPGSLYTIIGKNGCGKSTLLKSCIGLLPAASGTVRLDEKELTEYTSAERACKMSYLSQNASVPGITVERLVMHGRYPRLGYPKKLSAVDWDLIDRALYRMQVRDFRQKSVRELSGGERQRVYLAMLLAQDAPILLLDEPTTYMDIEYQLEFLDLAAELKCEGKTVIMVLHDLEQALRCSDQIVVMDGGAVVQTGTPQEILDAGTLTDIFHVTVSDGYCFKKASPHLR